MECGECTIRSSVGFCHECDILLCEVCSHGCERCGKTVCKSHIQRTSSGRHICVSCVVHHYDKRAKKAKERREMRAEAAVVGAVAAPSPGKKSSGISSSSSKPHVESFSFESLQADMGASPINVPEPSSTLQPYSPLVDQDAINQRVLTGSAPKRRPEWVTGLLLTALAWVVFVGAFTGTSLGGKQVICSGVAMLLSFGAVVWTGPSAISKGDRLRRRRGRLALAVGAITLIASGIVLYSRVAG